MKKAAAILIVALLAGCGTPGAIKGRLQPGMDDAPEGQRLTWPAAPEAPRYLYSGTLVGEPNFIRDPSESSALHRLGRWIAGLDAAGQPQLVLQRPSAVVGDQAGRLYVSDTSRQAVFVFDARVGELLLWEQATLGLRFVAPGGLAVSAGRLFVADAELKAVFVLDASGQPLARIGHGQLQRPTGVALNPVAGELFVADTMAHDIKVFDTTGRLLRTLGRRGEADGEFNFPTHLAWARGELFVTDTLNNRVQVLDAASGRVLRRLGQRGLFVGNLVRPKGVGVDAEGNIYIVESFYDSLLVFSPQGEFLMPIGGIGPATGRFYLPAGVWVDGQNRVHVADMFNGRIVLFQFLGGGG